MTGVQTCALPIYAYKLYSNEITLPLHTKLSDEDVDYVTSVFSDAVRMVRGY